MSVERLLNAQESFRLDNELLAKYREELDAETEHYVSLEWRISVLPRLKTSALCAGLPAQQYEAAWLTAWHITHQLFKALHARPVKPQFFWQHQPIEMRKEQYGMRGIFIDKGALLASAAYYLQRQEIRTSRLDWIFLDALVLTELIARCEYSRQTLIGISSQLAMEFTHSDVAGYRRIRRRLSVAGFIFNFVAWPAAVYALFVHEHQTWALATMGLWMLLQAAIAIIALRMRSERRAAMAIMKPLWCLYEILGGRTISPRKLKEATDDAAAAGIVFDGAVFAIVDRIIARDTAIFDPTGG